MYKLAPRFSILMIILIFSSLSASAATLSVSNNNDSGAGSLRQAVIDATSGDTINFSITGTITLTSGQILIDKNLTIIGPGSSNLAIDGNNNDRIFYISLNRTVTIFGLSLQNGESTDYGGAIYNEGTLTINNSSLSGNHTTSSGGAINNNFGTLTINNSSLSGNIADAYSGAIRNYDTVTVNNSTISGNSAGNSGGAMYNAGTLTVNNSTISGNSAVNGGGGFRNVAGHTITINNSTVSNNSASSGGGIIVYGTVNVNNSIISGNTAPGTPDCWFGVGTFNTDANNILGSSGSNGGCTNGASDIVPAGAIGTILSGLANNGAPTQTHALVGSSPAIDASGGGALATDQRGVAAQSTRDIGAFEFGVNPTYPTVQFSSTGTTYDETDGTVNIGVTISGASNFAGVAEVYVVDALTGSATSGSDYTAFNPQTLTIDCSSGTCPANTSISLTILTDSILENDEIVDLEIIGTNGFATIGAQSSFAATIQDTTTSTATISATDANASENPVDNGQFTVDLGAVNDTGSPITVNYSISGTATDGVDYTTLTGSVDVADGQQTVTIDVTPIVDTDFEGNETVELTLTSTNNASVSVDTTPATVTINDSATAIATITATDPVGAENPVDNGQFTVDLGIINNTGSTVTVNYSIAGTATAGVDYTALLGSLDIANGQQTATIDVIPINDVPLEGGETVELTLTSTNNASVTVDTTPATVTINDSAITTVRANKPNVRENRTDSGQFTIDLGISNNTGSVITINYSIAGTATAGVDYTTLSGSIDIANGQQTATIDVTPIDDKKDEGNETVEITLTSTNLAIVAIDNTPAIVTIIDDEKRSDDDADSTDDSSNTVTQPSNGNSNSDAVWSISISANPPFVQGGDTVIFTIEILKLSGGTPVTMEFPLADTFAIQSVSSNRGSVSFNGQIVTFSDDIHVGDTPVITVTTLLDQNLSLPFSKTVQTCIISPTNLCASVTLAQILELPSTGETPIWRNPIILVLLGGLLILGGAGAVLFRRVW